MPFSDTTSRAQLDEVPLRLADKFAGDAPASVPTLITVFNSAIARGACTVNPLRGKSRRSNGRRDKEPLTVREVEGMAAAAEAAHGGQFGRRMRALVLFAAYTGIRPGEAFALEHGDIDRATRRVMIKRR